jgi:hypothetical protein
MGISGNMDVMEVRLKHKLMDESKITATLRRYEYERKQHAANHT